MGRRGQRLGGLDLLPFLQEVDGQPLRQHEGGLVVALVNLLVDFNDQVVRW